MEEIQDLFKKISSKLLYIIPNTFRLKPDHPIPASKLTLEFIDHWPPDATVIMLCAIHNLTFRAEDRLSYSDEKDCLADSVSVGSTPDYTCYTIHNSLYLVAVVLETKVTYHKNALAQLLGYYIRSCSNIWRSGVCILLTI